MKVIYISGGINPNTIDKLIIKYKLKPFGYSQQWWDYSMAKGLSNSLKDDLFCISVPPISTYPSSKCLILPGIDDDKISNFYSLKGINLPLIKQISFSCGIKHIIRKIVKEYCDEKIIILTSYIYYQSAKPAFQLRKKHNNIKVVTFVPDLPDFYSSKDLGNHNILKRLFDVYKKKCVSIKNKYDGYLCFSVNQMEFLNQDRPFCIVDGVFDYENILKLENIHVEKDNSVLYAGGVYYKYGIKELVDGFILAKIPNIKLLIYGDGDAVEYVKEKEQYSVFYCGPASRDEILKREKKAILLINPRPTNQDFSACSFPSKLIEYMASGTTVLTSRLKCISEEYKKYMLYIDEISPEGIKNALLDFSENFDNNCKIGAVAQDYIKYYKNEIHQANVTVGFLRSI